MKHLFFLWISFWIFPLFAMSQIPWGKEYLANLFTQPLSYIVAYANEPPVVDGNINDTIWEKAVWTEYFQDIEGSLKPSPYFKTRAKMLWDENYLYIAAELEEQHVWANLTEHDQVVFFDNDFEVFIDPSNTTHQYFEYEVNARNTIFDLFLPKPYRTGSGALISWNSRGLKHAVQIYGSLNNPSDKDQGWTVELAIPFKDITVGNEPKIPSEGDIWRLNFSRVQWQTEILDNKYVKKKSADGKTLPEHNWVWSPQGIIDMHAPERWGYIQFAGKNIPLFQMPYTEFQRQYLWLVYYKQQEYRQKNGRFAQSLSDLDIEPMQVVADKKNYLTMEALPFQFYVEITDKNTPSITLNQEGYVSQSHYK